MREEFSLFSLGIGFDVDYDFLERIAMENRGMAQRIYANHDAAEQLRVRQGNTTKKKPIQLCITYILPPNFQFPKVQSIPLLQASNL